MSREIALKIEELVPQTMTRTRGKEASEAMIQKAKEAGASRVYLEMGQELLITASFIDELVQQASQIECDGGPEVVFVITEDSMLAKFHKSASWRNLTCRYKQVGLDSIQLLKPDSSLVISPQSCSGSKSGMHTARTP